MYQIDINVNTTVFDACAVVHQIDVNVNTTVFDACAVVHQIDLNVNTTVFDACAVVHQIDININTTVFDACIVLSCKQETVYQHHGIPDGSADPASATGGSRSREAGPSGETPGVYRLEIWQNTNKKNLTNVNLCVAQGDNLQRIT